MREFAVKQGVRGYLVVIGCQTAGFSTKEELIEAITEYVNDPKGTEEKYYTPPLPCGHRAGVSYAEQATPTIGYGSGGGTPTIGYGSGGGLR